MHQIRLIVEVNEPYTNLVDLDDEDNANFSLTTFKVVEATGIIYLEYDKNSPGYGWLHRYLGRFDPTNGELVESTTNQNLTEA